jgi:hypothetical protein
MTKVVTHGRRVRIRSLLGSFEPSTLDEVEW